MHPRNAKLPAKPMGAPSKTHNNNRPVATPSDTSADPEILSRGQKRQLRRDRLRARLEIEKTRLIAEETNRIYEDAAKKWADLEAELRICIRNEMLDEVDMLYADNLKDRAWKMLTKFLQNMIGPDTHLYAHHKDSHHNYVEQLKILEQTHGDTLSIDHPDFPLSDTTFVYAPGTHIGIEEETLEILWEARITPWQAMNSHRRDCYIKTCNTLMEYTQSQNSKKHGTEKETNKDNQPLPRHGKMYAAGWHQTRGEKGKDIVYYTVQKGSTVTKLLDQKEKYERSTNNLADVAAEYAQGLQSLFPLGYKILTEFVQRNDLPSFAQLDLLHKGELVAMPFANSLTITHSDFSNYVHCDRDAIAVAYGWWWVGYRGHSKDSWKLSLDGSFDHNQVTGGSFLIAQHGIAIDFARAEGLVEIYWRGKNDHHVTLASNSPENVTRFGTSVQITQSGVGETSAKVLKYVMEF
ncbi:hypothetical protein C8J55DRAFT_493846 [Lentinula edodes]|uniref:Tet-like 2OG-Fe(II) oxygenase domain-containing protein n=1 Tax=Lentinula lateritia TaxID=40482 RepID=A0A9W9DE05_9AGAR|nr:hypothetical protein C8J55DRAFT_493846 [Lentinula edodes]